MTTALQKHTSALVTPGFRSGEDISLLNPRPSEYLQDPDPLTRTDLSTRSRYIQHIINTSDIGDASLWENITAIECAEPRVFQTERSTLLIVLNETVTPEDLLASHGGREPQMDPRLLPYDHYKYLHVLTFFLRTPLYHNVSPEGKDWTSTSRWHTRISYCLRRKMPGRSRLQIHLWLLLGTTSLNAIKLGCLLSTFKEQQGTPLVTTGDAISSFLKSRCVYSVDMCLLSQGELLRTLDKRRGDNGTDASITYKRFEPKRLQYYRSVSFSRWVVYISSYERSNRPLC